MGTPKINRREFLRLSGLGAAALFTTGLRRPSLMGEEFMPDAVIDVTAKEKWVQILSGSQTRVWSYEGQLMSGIWGDRARTFPATIWGRSSGQRAAQSCASTSINNLAEDSVIHPHGLRVPEASMGIPCRRSGRARPRSIEFQIIDRAGPYWFHPHPAHAHGRAGGHGHGGTVHRLGR